MKSFGNNEGIVSFLAPHRHWIVSVLCYADYFAILRVKLCVSSLLSCLFVIFDLCPNLFKLCLTYRTKTTTCIFYSFFLV